MYSCVESQFSIYVLYETAGVHRFCQFHRIVPLRLPPVVAQPEMGGALGRPRGAAPVNPSSVVSEGAPSRSANISPPGIEGVASILANGATVRESSGSLGSMSGPLSALTGSRGAANEFRVTVRRGNGNMHEVNIHPLLTVHELNEMLGKQFLIDKFAIRLVHNRRLLRPHATIEQTGVTEESILQMVIVRATLQYLCTRIPMSTTSHQIKRVPPLANAC